MKLLALLPCSALLIAVAGCQPMLIDLRTQQTKEGYVEVDLSRLHGNYYLDQENRPDGKHIKINGSGGYRIIIEPIGDTSTKMPMPANGSLDTGVSGNPPRQDGSMDSGLMNGKPMNNGAMRDGSMREEPLRQEPMPQPMPATGPTR